MVWRTGWGKCVTGRKEGSGKQELNHDIAFTKHFERKSGDAGIG